MTNMNFNSDSLTIVNLSLVFYIFLLQGKERASTSFSLDTP